MDTGGEDSDTCGDYASGCDEVTAGVENVCDGDESSDGGGFVKNNEIEVISKNTKALTAKQLRRVRKKARRNERETFWDDDYVNGIRHMYEGVIYESNGKNCRQGVAIMISNNYKESSKLVFKDDNGRFIHVTYDYLGKVYNLVSLYAPNNYSERKEFFMFVREYISSLDNLIVGGDFNTTLSSLDRGGLSKHICDEAYKELFEIIHSCNVYDVWRSRNENKKKIFLEKNYKWYVTTKSY
ncbi:Hypothetical predicted protein [Mytilus galloprovincialis]|uniref:Endonuclease/exonuclease/phosphatase domain-containing protein n=1 Tax=Mytilus galloprovincialis TaxID=29158 RepID=A0A8B6CCM1_MYTGA|nr:Hypothetical predicted protein [Mytilus galloprovincialis]